MLGDGDSNLGVGLTSRFLRTVTFRIKFVSHSRFGMSPLFMSRLPLTPLSGVLASCSNGTSMMVFLGVMSSSSCSKASPSPCS